MNSPEILGRSFMNVCIEAGGNGWRGASDMSSCRLLAVDFRIFLKSDTCTSKQKARFS